MLEYTRFLREEEKDHREYLEKLYTITTSVLGVLALVGVGMIDFFHFKTRKEVKEAVDAQFHATVDNELQKRMGEFKSKLSQQEEQLEDAKQAVESHVKELQAVRELATVAQSRAAYGVGKAPSSEKLAGSALPEIQKGQEPDDPWAGQFGRQSEAKNRRLEASLKPVSGQPNLYSIQLTVCSTDPHGAPLTGVVQFYLHETFANSKPIVPVTKGKAELNIVAWGAFTVGALADEGQTHLELDLAKNPDAPEPFRSR